MIVYFGLDATSDPTMSEHWGKVDKTNDPSAGQSPIQRSKHLLKRRSVAAIITVEARRIQLVQSIQRGRVVGRGWRSFGGGVSVPASSQKSDGTLSLQKTQQDRPNLQPQRHCWRGKRHQMILGTDRLSLPQLISECSLPGCQPSKPRKATSPRSARDPR